MRRENETVSAQEVLDALASDEDRVAFVGCSIGGVVRIGEGRCARNEKGRLVLPSCTFQSSRFFSLRYNNCDFCI